MRNSRFEGDRKGNGKGKEKGKGKGAKKGKEEYLQHTISLNLSDRENEYGNESSILSKALFEMRLSRINFGVK